MMGYIMGCQKHGPKYSEWNPPKEKKKKRTDVSLRMHGELTSEQHLIRSTKEACHLSYENPCRENRQNKIFLKDTPQQKKKKDIP